jgi:hypothetical protein
MDEDTKRKALYDAASSLANTTHMDELRAFAIATRDMVETEGERAARVEAEEKHAEKLKKQIR